MKTIRNLLALFLLTLGTIAHAESISVSPVILEPGGIVSIPVNCEFSCEDITLYQFDLYLPEGVTLVKNAKGRYAAGTTYVLSDRHDEHTANLKDNSGFVRFVVSQNDKYLITPGDGLLLTLYVQADANVSGELQASIKNFMMFEQNQTKHAMSDVTFKMMVPAANIPVTGITLNKTTASLTSRGQTLQLTATVTPDNATDKSVIWSSSNTSVATVDANGLVTAVASGSATITAKAADGSNKTATCAVTVNISVPVTGITLNQTTATLTSRGQTLQLTAIVTPDNATDKSVTWSSNNTSVATVDANGLVTAVSNGTATITAKTATTSDGSNKTATCAVTVNISVPASEGISVSPVTLESGGIVPIPVNCNFSCEDITLYQFDLYLPEGVTLAKNNKGRYAVGTTYVLSDRHDEHTASLKDNTGFVRFVVSQNDGYLITPGDGLLLTLYVQADASVSGELQASIKNFMMFETDETKHAMSDVTFKMMVPSANIPVTGITLNKTTASLTSRGQTLQLTATVTPDNATDKSVTWSSSNTAVATVSSTGLVTAVSSGTATITAKAADGSNKTATCAVTVNISVPVTGITLNQTTATLTSRGQTLQLTATVTPDDATDKSLTWSSSNPSVATVDANGLVTAVSSGRTTITATTADGSNKTATCAVTVNISVPVTGITLNQTTATLSSRGQTLQLTATVTPENATNKSVTWSSSNTAVATVSSTGLVTAVSSGSATITAKASDGSNKTATCAVTVNISVPVTGISLNQTTATLTSRGQTLQLTATVTPENATNKSVTWSSSNTSVATVDANGLVTAVFNGTATITAKTATTSDGSNKTATCAVTVNISVPVTGISLNQTTATLTSRGQTLQLTATVTPENATDKSVTWSSSNPSVATVDANGLVTAVSSGTATITAKTATTSDGSSKTATCAVTVNISVPASEGISVSPVTLESGGIVPIPVNCNFSCEDITLYQFDLYLPEGVTLAKNNKGRYAVGTTYVLSDRHDEHTASLKDNTGFVRFVVSQNDGYLITPGEGLLLTLYVQADASVSGELQASIKNFMMFETDETKHAMSDVTFKMMVPAINQNIQFADAAVKAICVAKWDTNGDGELSKDEAAQVTNIGTIFKSNESITSFDELQYFTGLRSIGSSAFYGCSGLTSVTIPNSVTSIGSHAFYNCSNLTSVTIPNSVTSIDRFSFSGTAWFDNQPDGLVYLGKVAYKYKGTMPSGTHITLKEGTLGIAGDAFYGCSGLTSVTIGNSVTSIRDYAFSGCSGLTSVTIPNSVTSISGSAFSGCSGLTSLKVEEGNPKYDSRNNCNAIIESSTNTLIAGCKTTTIPNSVKRIGSWAFMDCSGLTSLKIPNSVTSIGSYAFRDCSGLTSVTIPNSVTSIEVLAFSDCSGLTSINVEEGNPKYDSRDNCNAIIEISTNTLVVGCQNTVIPNSVTSIGSYAFYGCSGLTSVTIPNSVTSIGISAFYKCSTLTSVSIPNSVTSIGDYAFCGCSGLTSITIPNSVTSIGSSAFSDCSGLTSVTIPNSVTSIGSSAFSGCSGLTSVTIPNSVTSIGNYAFSSCSGLTSVTIPNSVTSIGDKAFYYCRSLSEVWCMAKRVPTTGTDVFLNASISSATLYVPISSVENYKSTAPWMEFGSFSTIYDIEADDIYYNINEDGTSVSVTHGINDDNTYSGSVVIPAVITDDGKEYNVTGIGESAFSNCTDLISVTLPNGVTSISNDAIPSTTKIYVDKGVYPLIAVWNYGRNPYDLSTNTCLTPPFNTRINSNASSIGLIANVSENLIKTENESLTINGVTKKGQKARFNGLTPNTYYQVQYDASVIYGDGSATFSSNGNISTKSLTLTLSPPKVFSLGNAIVEASSNLDDDEENVGFEWRRMDWSDEMMSNRGVAYLYEGIMEGNIRNLNTEQYWKVRPYYMANDGTYYYGEWGGFDPANTSYFEPTVHTYSKIDQTDNKVQISGYVQRATDAVSKQGFKYWIQEDEGYARGAGVSIPTGARTVEAEGRVMEVELTGLMPNTTYAYVAFVTTVEGETFYGKQQSFTTGDDPAAAIVGDANGNGEVEIGDVTSVLTLMATPEATGYNNEAADANGNGEIEIGDVTTILTIMATGGK